MGKGSSGAGWGTGGTTTAWLKVRKQVIARDGYTCQTCGIAVHPRCNPKGCGDCIHVAHRIAKADGGPDHPDNAMVSCRSCNLRGPAIRHNPTPPPPRIITPPEW